MRALMIIKYGVGAGHIKEDIQWLDSSDVY
jgi:hypothetical protein